MQTTRSLAKATRPEKLARRLRAASANSLLPFLLVLFLASPVALQAQFQYTTNGGTITITGYTGSGGDVTIPNTINGLPVTSIGEWTFSHCTSLTSITIPNSVTSIGDFAFIGSGLMTITIPTGVTSIGNSAFGECLSLTHITIPNSVTSIGHNVFYSCFKLNSVSLPGSLINIGGYAFVHCRSLTSIFIPKNVAMIWPGAFSSCDNLTGIDVDSENPSYSSLDGVGCSTEAVVQVVLLHELSHLVSFGPPSRMA